MKNNTSRKPTLENDASFEASLTSIIEYHDTMQRLRKGIKDFEAKLAHRLNEGEADSGQVKKLIATAKSMLDLCRKNPREKYVAHCLAAVDYFLECADAIPDFQSLEGFDDDESVFRMVKEKFKLKLD